MSKGTEGGVGGWWLVMLSLVIPIGSFGLMKIQYYGKYDMVP